MTIIRISALAAVAMAFSTASYADDLQANCKANPMPGAPSGIVEKVCACIDTETTGNDALRKEFDGVWKFKTPDERRAHLSQPGQDVLTKCKPKIL